MCVYCVFGLFDLIVVKLGFRQICCCSLLFSVQEDVAVLDVFPQSAAGAVRLCPGQLLSKNTHFSDD